MEGEGAQTSLDYQNCNEVLVNGKNGGTDPHPDRSASEEMKVRTAKTEEEMRECRYCKFKAEDWPAFARHVFRGTHIKKVAEAYNIKLPKAPSSSSYTCNVCSITCCGHQAFNAHMLGAKHRKALQQKAAEKEQSAGGGKMKTAQLGSTGTQNKSKPKKPYDKPSQKPTKSIGANVFTNYPQPLIGLEYVTEVQVTGHHPRYECSLCDAKFEHDVKFPHLVGQKHRMNVLKIKRPDFVKELHPTSKKRSELTAALLKESIDVEQKEGRKEVKFRREKPPPETTSPRGRGTTHGGAVGIQGGRNNVASSSSIPPLVDSWSGRGASFSRGGETNMGSYVSTPSRPPSYSSYGSYGVDRYHPPPNNDRYSLPYNSAYDSASYSRSASIEQGYSQSQPSFYDSGYNFGPPPQIETTRNFEDVPSESSGLANALGDLTKLVQNDEDASVALQVSNALTKALLKYRMEDNKQDFY